MDPYHQPYYCHLLRQRMETNCSRVNKSSNIHPKNTIQDMYCHQLLIMEINLNKDMNMNMDMNMNKPKNKSKYLSKMFKTNINILKKDMAMNPNITMNLFTN